MGSGYKKRIKEREEWKKKLLAVDSNLIDVNNGVSEGFYGNLHAMLGMSNQTNTSSNINNSWSLRKVEPETQNDTQTLERVEIEKQDATSQALENTNYMHNGSNKVKENKTEDLKYHIDKISENQKETYRNKEI